MVAREQGVSYNDYEGIERLFNKFCENHKGDNIEHALVVTMDGEVYHCKGKTSAVDIAVLGSKL